MCTHADTALQQAFDNQLQTQHRPQHHPHISKRKRTSLLNGLGGSVFTTTSWTRTKLDTPTTPPVTGSSIEKLATVWSPDEPPNKPRPVIKMVVFVAAVTIAEGVLVSTTGTTPLMLPSVWVVTNVEVYLVVRVRHAKNKKGDRLNVE